MPPALAQEGSERRFVGSFARWRVTALTLAVALAAASSLGAFQTPGEPRAAPKSPRAEPRLRGAATRPPEGIGPDAPFDVVAFFAAPPAELDAAPLYLEALFEFEPDLANCFPPGAETTHRKEIAKRRKRSIESLYAELTKDPASVSDKAIDELVAELEPALHRVEDAQRRAQCVFQTSLDIVDPLPHAQAARQVDRLLALKTRRCVARGDIETPLHDLEVDLRLARDLRPRGPMLSQLVATAMTWGAMDQVIPTLLASPSFRDEHGRRLLALLGRHETVSIDGYQEGLRFQYLILRQILTDIVKEPRGSISKALGDLSPIPGKADDGAAFGRLLEQELEAKPSVIAVVNARVDQYFRDVLAFHGPVAEWPGEQLDPKRIRDDSYYSWVPLVLMPSTQGMAQIEARAKLAPRAAQCLVALRLWRDRTKEPPTDLEAVVKAAGMARVPIDPYSGKPLRMAIIDGEPVIYSIGKDGRDDGGRIDSKGDRNPGDQVFRLPPVETRRP
jgi:hypothetical protein